MHSAFVRSFHLGFYLERKAGEAGEEREREREGNKRTLAGKRATLHSVELGRRSDVQGRQVSESRETSVHGSPSKSETRLVRSSRSSASIVRSSDLQPNRESRWVTRIFARPCQKQRCPADESTPIKKFDPDEIEREAIRCVTGLRDWVAC